MVRVRGCVCACVRMRMGVYHVQQQFFSHRNRNAYIVIVEDPGTDGYSTIIEARLEDSSA